MTREEAFKEINDTQEYYVDELIKRILDPENKLLKEDNFTSDTGTGKTVMIKKLAQKLPDYYFVLTTLSKGQLNVQTSANLSDAENITVYGINQFTENTKLKAKDILNQISKSARGRKIIWLRDEGHIHTNKWNQILPDISFKIINISATNKTEGLRTNFIHTLMLRTVHQQEGTFDDALDKLMIVKKQHSKVKNYNPCGIFRSLDNKVTQNIIKSCQKRGLKYIDLTNNDKWDVLDICKNDNQYDVIINKFKMVEGIDLKRAHVLYMTSVPANYATTIQVIGRCRRNALLYEDPQNIGVDIFSPKNKTLLHDTMQCYVFNNVIGAEVPTDKDGNLVLSFCDTISVQQLKPNIEFELENGQLPNGIKLVEAGAKLSGKFVAALDRETGFNILKYDQKHNETIEFYKKETQSYNESSLVLSVYGYKKKAYKKKNNDGMLTCDGYLEKRMTTKQAIIEGQLVPCYIHYTWSDEWIKEYCYDIIDIDGKHIFVPRDSLDLQNISQISYYPYEKITNDKEQAIVGVDAFKFLADTQEWVEERAVTAKISKHTKLQSFIAKTYSTYLETAKNKCFTGHNEFEFTDNKLNTCLGYCVEYYSKYLVYGKEYLKPYLNKAFKEAHTKKLCDGIIIRACLLKYKDNMAKCFGKAVQKVIRTISMHELVCENLAPFISAVKQLGQKTANFVKQKLHISKQLSRGDKLYDPNLSTLHISGLADYITKDTIIDIKTTNSITINHIKQVLAYHYLSTKRSDLNIKHVIVYDAVSGKSVEIDL